MSTPMVRRAGMPSLYEPNMPSDLEERPYKLYRAGPRGLRARLRGEEQGLLPRGDERGKERKPEKPRDAWSITKRVLKWVAIVVVAWLLLSLGLFLIIVNLAAFPQFVDAIGGVDVKTGRVCATISGGVQNGGFSLFLKPGTHHLNGTQALTYARMRHNSCNSRDSDLTRVAHQQQILN